MVLEVSGISGRLVGFISTYPRTSPTPWYRVIAKRTGWVQLVFHLQYVGGVGRSEMEGGGRQSGSGGVPVQSFGVGLYKFAECCRCIFASVLLVLIHF